VRTTQERFFDDLDELAESARCEVTVEYDYSNKGRFTIAHEGTYEPRVTASFQFSNGHNLFRSEGLFPGHNPDMYLAKDLKGLGEVIGYIADALC
jgi:hypothetical protein